MNLLSVAAEEPAREAVFPTVPCQSSSLPTLLLKKGYSLTNGKLTPERATPCHLALPPASAACPTPQVTVFQEKERRANCPSSSLHLYLQEGNVMPHLKTEGFPSRGCRARILTDHVLGLIRTRIGALLVPADGALAGRPTLWLGN